MQITVGIITVSDRASRGEYDDLGGPALKEAAAKNNWSVLAKQSSRMKSSRCRKRSGPSPAKAADLS